LLGILLVLEQHHPVLTFGEPSRRGPWRYLPRLREVEDEDASRGQSCVDAVEERKQSLAVALGIEQVVEDLADGRDSVAWGISALNSDPTLNSASGTLLRAMPIICSEMSIPRTR
jgi:hypothetical protein